MSCFSLPFLLVKTLFPYSMLQRIAYTRLAWASLVSLDMEPSSLSQSYLVLWNTSARVESDMFHVGRTTPQ